jgi:DNA-binding transcriptional regulator YdaS (Cro superfamily)
MDIFGRLVDLYKTQAAAAGALGVSRQAFFRWKKAGKIPPSRALDVEEKTRGFVTAKDVLRQGRPQ